MLKQRLNKSFLKDPSRWQFWVLIAFLCKGIIFIFLLYRNGESGLPGFRGIIAGDTGSYLIPIENLILHGSYAPDFRMPGYGILYMPYIFLFRRTIAFNLLIISQFIVASLTVYPLALTAKNIFKSNTLFYLTFYLFAISTYTNLFDSTLLTESFATSFLILSVFFLVKAIQIETKRSLNLFMAGLFLTEVIFLRPVFMPLILLFALVLFTCFFIDKSQKNSFLNLTLFLLPFLVFDGLWVARNYSKYDKLIPATASIAYPKIMNSYYYPIYTLARSWGGSDQVWEPNAEIRWFGINDGLEPQLHNVKVTLPSYIYTSKFNYDSLVILKKQLTVYISHESDTVAINSPEMKSLLSIIRGKCFLYANSIKSEKPFLYYVIAPIMRIKTFLIHSGTPNLFLTLTSQLNPVAYTIKIFYSLIYLLVIGFGAIGMILLFKRSILFTPVVLITGIVFYTILIHPVILGMCEKRYFVPAYPFMLICAAYAISWAYKKISHRTKN